MLGRRVPLQDIFECGTSIRITAGPFFRPIQRYCEAQEVAHLGRQDATGSPAERISEFLGAFLRALVGQLAVPRHDVGRKQAQRIQYFCLW